MKGPRVAYRDSQWDKQLLGRGGRRDWEMRKGRKITFLRVFCARGN